MLEELDKQEYNNDHAETRRHCFLSVYDPDEYYFAAEKDGFDEVVAVSLELPIIEDVEAP